MSERQGYHHGDLAAALLLAASAAVRAAGAQAFSLRSVARAVGVDVAAVYRHFTNRSDLLQAVADAGFAALEARMRATIAGVVDPEARLLGVGRAYVEFALDEPHLFRLMFALGPRAASSPPPHDPYGVLLAALDDLAAGSGLGLAREDAALVAWSAVHGLAALALDGPLDAPLARSRIEPVLRTVLAGLVATPDRYPPRAGRAPG